MQHDRFLLSATHIKGVTGLKLSSDDQLELYSLYKQATIGDNVTSSPGWLDFVGRAKWTAWYDRIGMTRETAEQLYVDLVTRLSPAWEAPTEAKVAAESVELEDEQGERERTMGMTVSRFAIDDGDISEWQDNESLLSLISNNDVTGLELVLKSATARTSLNQSCQLPPLHLACDRSSISIIETLIGHGADVNLKDFEGQSCLFNAILRERLDVVQLLLSAGASVDQEDNSGLTPLFFISETDNSSLKALCFK